MQWLIVGLGNPGSAYARTRHNAGAWLLNYIRRAWKLPKFTPDKRANALVSKQKVGVRSLRPELLTPTIEPLVFLAFPQTFMNESGRSVAALVRTHRIPLDHLLVLHDDKDILLGKLKLQRNRSAAGHKGVQSVIDALESKDFWRVRVGIGKTPQEHPTDAFVLGTFIREEQKVFAGEVAPLVESTLSQILATR